MAGRGLCRDGSIFDLRRTKDNKVKAPVIGNLGCAPTLAPLRQLPYPRIVRSFGEFECPKMDLAAGYRGRSRA
jgi:hypothetical protein